MTKQSFSQVSGVILTAEGILPGDIHRKPRTRPGWPRAAPYTLEKKGLNHPAWNVAADGRQV
jgi:hypothetical protein